MGLITSVSPVVKTQGWLEFFKRAGRERQNFVRVVEPLFFQPPPHPQELEPLEYLSRYPSDIYGHLPTLFMLSTEFKSRTIVELGTRGGLSTTAFLLAAKRTGGHVFSFDIDPCIDAKKQIERLGLEEYWTFTQADDLKVPWNKTIDHLFIDTSHTFAQTLAELQKFERYVKQGGIITMHDFVSFVEVDDALRKYAGNRTDLRIYRYFNNNGLAVVFKEAHDIV